MRTAIEQFAKASTTISQTPKKLSKLEAPIFTLCPDPPFKLSFFKNHSVRSLGVEKYSWLFPKSHEKFENHLAPDVYMEMCHHLGSDWKILIIDVNLDPDR